MATIKVKALRLGYYEHLRRREGDVFDMELDIFMPKNKQGKPFMKDDKPVVCSWVEPLEQIPGSVSRKKASFAASAPESTAEESADSEVI